MLPNEIIDHILSYCDGYTRTDLKRYKIKVKLKNNILNIDNNLELQCYDIYNSNNNLQDKILSVRYTFNIGDFVWAKKFETDTNLYKGEIINIMDE